MSEKVIVYKTIDGRLFSSEEAANSYEKDLAFFEWVKDYLQDDFSAYSTDTICSLLKHYRKELIEHLSALDGIDFCKQK